jgi:hypothetical protein
VSDEETRNKRKLKFRNKHAKELYESDAFRIKRVESKRKANPRFTTQQWMKRIYERDDDSDEVIE